MLMRFSISNFMSFASRRNENGEILPTEFHLYAGRTEQHRERVIHFGDRKVLKFCSVYGANASGKTNLVCAIDAGREIVLKTMEEVVWRDDYCKSKKENADMPTLFEYEFTIGEKCYAYGYTVNLSKTQILSEWLYEIRGKEEYAVYERDAVENRYYFDESIFEEEENRRQFHYFLKDVNRIQTSLLLYEIKRRRLKERDFDIFSEVFDWFKYSLVVVYPDTDLGASYLRFSENNAKLGDVLNYFDTGITDYYRKPIREEAFKEYFPDEKLARDILKKYEREGTAKLKGIVNLGHTLIQIERDENGRRSINKLMFQHGTDEGNYEYGEESDGTRRLIELLDVILNDREKVFVVDELDRSLHPQMTIKFVETFLKFSEEKNTQLIITTHESNLMDLNILRRDEIWFAERGEDNSTYLYSLEKFKTRYDKAVARAYLAGRYGAVPVFKDFEYVWGRV